MRKDELQRVLDRVRSGDPAATERAVAALEETVYSFAMKVCGHREDAEDTMQETLVKAYQQMDRFEDSRAMVVWLYKVAKNFCLMSRRQSKFEPRQKLSLEELMPAHGASPGPAVDVADQRELPDEAAIRGEFRRRLERAVLELPKSHRLVVILRDMEGLSNEEVAEVMALPLATVKMRLHRARLFLRRELGGFTEGEQSHERKKGRRRARPKRPGTRPVQENLRATL